MITFQLVCLVLFLVTAATIAHYTNGEEVPERRALHAYLSPNAHEAWMTFAEANGVSVTGLLEHMGHMLADEIKAAPDDVDVLRRDWVRGARRIDADRRRRDRSGY